jgi:hypothetical protein
VYVLGGVFKSCAVSWSPPNLEKTLPTPLCGCCSSPCIPGMDSPTSVTRIGADNAPNHSPNPQGPGVTGACSARRLHRARAPETDVAYASIEPSDTYQWLKSTAGALP